MSPAVQSDGLKPVAYVEVKNALAERSGSGEPMAALPDWGKRFLEQRRHATVATIEPDGSPHVVPVWYVFRDGMLCVGTQSSSRKAKNAIARPTATLTIDSREPGDERWVSATGPVTILRGDQARPIVAAIQERYLTGDARQDPRVGGALAAVDDVVIAIRPATWRAWASAEMDQQFFGGLLSANRDKWFRTLD
jgi:F420H(2)-dependent biliverdin reductase